MVSQVLCGVAGVFWCDRCVVVSQVCCGKAIVLWWVRCGCLDKRLCERLVCAPTRHVNTIKLISHLL